MWPLKTILYFGFFWTACLAALVNPIWGVVNYMIAYQTNPPVAWWGQPLVAVGMRFSLLAIVFTIIGMLLSGRRMPVSRPALTFWELGVVGLLLVALVAAINGVAFDSVSQGAFEKFWKLQIFVLILVRLAITRRNMQIVLWSIVAGSLYLGYDAYTAPASAFSKGRLEVFGGPDIATSSGASAHLTAMLPLIGVAYLTTRRWSLKFLAAVAGAFTVNAIVLCRTRSAFLGIACGVLAAVLAAPQARRFRIYALMLVGAVLAFALTDDNYWTRIATIADAAALEVDPATTSRQDIWRASWSMIADHPLGVGLGNFAQMIGEYDARYPGRSPHNTLILCFAELGIVGGVLFVMVLLESLRMLYAGVRHAHQSDRPLETKLLAYGFLISLVTYFVAGMGTERFSCESFWWVLALPLCLYRLVRQETHAAEASRVPTAQQGLEGRPWVPRWSYGV